MWLVVVFGGGECIDGQEHGNQIAQEQVQRARKAADDPAPSQDENDARPDDTRPDGIEAVSSSSSSPDVVEHATPSKPATKGGLTLSTSVPTKKKKKKKDASVDHSTPDLSELAADAEAAMKSNSAGDLVADDAPRHFAVDEPVEVWSDHRNEWSAARVTSVHAAGQHAALVTCRLAGVDRQLQTLFSKSPLLRKVVDGAGGVKSPTIAKCVHARVRACSRGCVGAWVVIVLPRLSRFDLRTLHWKVPEGATASSWVAVVVFFNIFFSSNLIVGLLL